MSLACFGLADIDIASSTLTSLPVTSQATSRLRPAKIQTRMRASNYHGEHLRLLGQESQRDRLLVFPLVSTKQGLADERRLKTSDDAKVANKSPALERCQRGGLHA